MGHPPRSAEVSQGLGDKLRFTAWKISKDGRHWQRINPKHSESVIIRTADNVASLDVAEGRADGSRTVVNVFVGKNDNGSKASMSGEQFVVYKMLRRAAGLDNEPRDCTLDERLLGKHNYSAVETICDRETVVDAFRPLLELVFPWQDVHIPMFEDMRKCWCFEEIVNYLKHMNRQLDEITLGRDPRVVPFIDAGSLKKLESKAPMLSVRDREYVVRQFQDHTIFTGLSDRILLQGVKDAVCRQGAILSLWTLAQDVRVLRRYIHGPLKRTTGKLSNKKNQTTRSVMRKYFEDRIVPPLQIVEHLSGDKLASRCYERLFIQLLRKLPDHMTEEDIDNVWRNEEKKSPHEIWSSGSSIERAEHGVPLFGSASRTQAENRRVIAGSFPITYDLRSGVMARYLACVFLFDPHKVDIMANDSVLCSPTSSLLPRISFPHRAYLSRVPKHQATRISRRNSWRRSYRASRCGSPRSPTLCETPLIVSPSSVYSRRDSMPLSAMSWPGRDLPIGIRTSEICKKRYGMYVGSYLSNHSQPTLQGSIERCTDLWSPTSLSSTLCETTYKHKASQSSGSGSSVYPDYDSQPSTGLRLGEREWGSLLDSYREALDPFPMSSAASTGNRSEMTMVDADGFPFSMTRASSTNSWASSLTRIASPEYREDYSQPDSMPAPRPAHREQEVITFLLRGTVNRNKNLDTFYILRSKYEIEKFLQNQLAHNAETKFSCRGIGGVIAPELHDRTRIIAPDSTEEVQLLVDSIFISEEVIVFSAKGWNATTYPYHLA